MELISDFLTAHSAWIGLGLLVGLITLFALEKFPLESQICSNLFPLNRPMSVCGGRAPLDYRLHGEFGVMAEVCS